MKKRISIVAIVVIYFLIGITIYLFTSKEKEIIVEDDVIEQRGIILAGSKFERKIIGKDNCITRIVIPIKENHLNGNKHVSVCIMNADEREYNDGSYKIDTIVGKNDENIVFNVSSSDLRSLRYGRDYYLIVDGTCIDRNEIILFSNKNNEFYVKISYLIRSPFFFLWKYFLITIPVLLIIMDVCGVNALRAVGIEIVAYCILLYTISLFDLFQMIMPIFYAISIISILYIIASNLIDNIIWHKVLPELVAFIILSVLLFLYSSIQEVHQWDEMTQWASVVKGMWIYDAMPQNPYYFGKVFRYPPVYSLFQLLFIKINNEFSEGILYFSKYIMQTGIVISTFSFVKPKKNRWYRIFVLFVLAILIPGILFDKMNYTLYCDSLSGALMGYFFVCFSNYYLEKESGALCRFELAGAVFLVTLTKEIGMIAILAVSLGTTIQYIIQRLKKNNVKLLHTMLFSIIVFLISKLSWTLFLRIRTPLITDSINIQTSAGLRSLKECIDFLFKRGYRLFINIIPELIFSKRFILGQYRITFFCLMFIIVALFIITYASFGINKIYRIKQQVVIGCFSSIAFLLGLIGAYCLVFSDAEAIAFASIERYLACWVLGIVIYMIFLIIENEEEKMVLLKRMSFICIIILLQIGIDTAYNERGAKINNRAIYEKVRNVLNEKDKVYYVGAGDNGAEYMRFLYYSAPVRFNNYFYYKSDKEFDVSYCPRVNKPSQYERELSLCEFSEELLSYDYLFVYSLDDIFIGDYKALFKDEIKEGTLYRVVTNGKKIELLMYESIF